MSFRLEKLNSLLREELSQMILKEISFPFDTLTTITKVVVSSDLTLARVWISVLPEEKRKIVLKTLQKNKARLQSGLNRRLKIKRIPKIRFILDVSEEKADRINRLLDEIINEV